MVQLASKSAIMLINGSQPDSYVLEWYCARTLPKHEHIAAANLRKNLGLEVFNPRLEVKKATRRGRITFIEPLFPCYVFVRCRIAESLTAMRYSSGVRNLVHFGDRIPTVPEEVIRELRSCFESEEPMPVEEQLSAGTEVIVMEGAFMGAHAKVVRMLPAKQRVQVLLEFLGRTTMAEVDRRAVVPEERKMSDFLPLLAVPLESKANS